MAADLRRAGGWCPHLLAPLEQDRGGGPRACARRQRRRPLPPRRLRHNAITTYLRRHNHHPLPGRQQLNWQLGKQIIKFFGPSHARAMRLLLPAARGEYRRRSRRAAAKAARALAARAYHCLLPALALLCAAPCAAPSSNMTTHARATPLLQPRLSRCRTELDRAAIANSTICPDQCLNLLEVRPCGRPVLGAVHCTICGVHLCYDCSHGSCCIPDQFVLVLRTWELTCCRPIHGNRACRGTVCWR